MWKKTLTVILLTAVLLMLLPCTAAAASAQPCKHLYNTSFFGGFTYCMRCHEYTFSLTDVNWFTVFIVAAGLAFLIALVVLAIKNRGSGMRADRAAKSFGMVEKFPDSPAPRARKTGTETGNPALALHLLKEEDERPQD